MKKVSVIFLLVGALLLSTTSFALARPGKLIGFGNYAVYSQISNQTSTIISNGNATSGTAIGIGLHGFGIGISQATATNSSVNTVIETAIQSQSQ
jgi:hypothetical protein